MENLREKFRFKELGTMGLEEEVWLVDEKGRLVPAALGVLKQAAWQIGISNGNWQSRGTINRAGEEALARIKNNLRLQPELPAQQLELTTPVCRRIDELIDNLADKREWLKALAGSLGLRLLFDPVPRVGESDLHIFPSQRYQGIYAQLGQGVLPGFISGLHFHYGLDSHEQAIRVLNRLGPNLLDGFRDFYSPKRLENYSQISGPDKLLPPALKDWRHYEEALSAMGAAEDPTFCWWLVRLSPYGTVELRVADVFEDLNQVKSFLQLAKAKIEEAL